MAEPRERRLEDPKTERADANSPWHRDVLTLWLLLIIVLGGTVAIASAPGAGGPADGGVYQTADKTPYFSVTINEVTSPVVAGERVDVTATIENRGSAAGSQQVALEIGGEQRDATEVALSGGENTTVTLTWETAAGDSGSYEATVASDNDADTASVLVREAPRFAVEITETTAPITAGDSLEVKALVENAGDAAGSQTVTLAVDGEQRDATEVTLSGGENTTVTLTWETTAGDSGTYEPQVASDDDSDTTAVTVRRPPEFAIDAVETNAPVTAGDSLTITANVSNTGGREATQTVTLAVGGQERDNRSLTLGAMASTRVSLTWETGDGDAGEYTATVRTANDSVRPDVRVEEPSADSDPPNDPPTVDTVAFVPCDPACSGDSTTAALADEELEIVYDRYKRVEMRANDAEDPDGNITSYEWRIDGEVVGSEPTIEHTFDSPGEYTLELVISDDSGATSRVSQQLRLRTDESGIGLLPVGVGAAALALVAGGGYYVRRRSGTAAVGGGSGGDSGGGSGGGGGGMAKAELIDSIASEADITKADARKSVDAFIDTTTKALKKGNRVALAGMGSFTVSSTDQPTGRNISKSTAAPGPDEPNPSESAPEGEETMESPTDTEPTVEFTPTESFAAAAGVSPADGPDGEGRTNGVDDTETERGRPTYEDLEMSRGVAPDEVWDGSETTSIDAAQLAAMAQLAEADAEEALDAFIDTTTKALQAGEPVDLGEFGSLEVDKRSARKGRNPQTGKEIKIPAKKVVKFKPGAELSEKIK